MAIGSSFSVSKAVKARSWLLCSILCRVWGLVRLYLHSILYLYSTLWVQRQIYLIHLHIELIRRIHNCSWMVKLLWIMNWNKLKETTYSRQSFSICLIGRNILPEIVTRNCPTCRQQRWILFTVLYAQILKVDCHFTADGTMIAKIKAQQPEDLLIRITVKNLYKNNRKSLKGKRGYGAEVERY
jgi:hypothetical protein